MSWTLVLTAAPGRGLSSEDIDAARRGTGCETGAPVALGPDAAEIVCEMRPALPALPGVDANAVPSEGRTKRILMADMDSTIIGVECIDEIADFAGVKARVAEITERAMAGEIGFEGALCERVALLEGLPEDTLDRVHADRIRLNPGARILVRTMAARGAATALVSGGFTWFTGRVAREAGFAEHRANTLETVAGRLTGTVATPILGQTAKLDALHEIAAELGADPSDAVAVGDGANDLAMIRAAGLGVGYRPKPALAAEADAVIAHADLTAVLHLQGLHADDFVRD